MKKNLYIDIHVLQTVPPSCVNRDDTGSPKTALYGGATRARVSSQAWKRAVRQMFKDTLEEESTGIRTRNTTKLIADAIQAIDVELPEDEAKELSETMLSLGKAKGEGKDVLFFISQAQIKEVAKLAVQYRNESKEVGKDKKAAKTLDSLYEKKIQTALKENPAIDMILFGRMSASNTDLNYDACCQVSHAISTHAVSNEFDYFTAVDDFGADDNAGAGHLGTVEFNSSTLYRYAALNIGGLNKYLDVNETADAVAAFIDAFVRAMPTGKQNSFANRTIPDALYIALREDQPVNMAGAFERPVTSGSDGYSEKSKAALKKYSMFVYENFVPAPVFSWTVGMDGFAGAERKTLLEAIAALKAELLKYTEE